MTSQSLKHVKNQFLSRSATLFSKIVFTISMQSCLCLIILTIFSSSAFAQTFDVGTRTAAMGGATSTISHSGSAVINNPAAIVNTQSYAVEGSYSYRRDSHVVSASVVDSKTNPHIGAGVGYSYYHGVKEMDGITGHDIRFAIGVPVWSDRLVLGVGGHYTWLFQESGEEERIELMKGFTLNAGLLFRIIDNLRLGFSANHMIPVCKKALCKTFLPLQFQTGLAYSINKFTIAVDADVDLSRHDALGFKDNEKKAAVDVGVGAEYVIVDMVPIRLGYRYVDMYPEHRVTVGAGFQSQYFSVNASYEIDVKHKWHYFLFNLVVNL